MIVILTGAGISQESGIDTFRDKGGLWESIRIEDVATASAYRRNPERVLAFTDELRRGLKKGHVAPNTAHKALARLEKEYSGGVLLVTQNIDNLHERAGSEDPLHMHGELLKVRCERCCHVLHWEEDLPGETPCPACGSTHCLRPDIVLFEEMPYHMDEIARALARCRLFVSIGTSGNVYPAAGFAAEAKSRGARVLELNLDRPWAPRPFTTAAMAKPRRLCPPGWTKCLGRHFATACRPICSTRHGAGGKRSGLKP